MCVHSQPGATEGFAVASAHAIAAGADGNLWFTSGQLTDAAIGCLAPSGTLLGLFPLLSGSQEPGGIVAGTSGDIWFDESIAGLGVLGNRIAHFKVDRL